jgi:hypothetical protein
LDPVIRIIAADNMELIFLCWWIVVTHFLCLIRL